jgi:ribosomal protein S18 acetylase RimI-like enzyme
MADRAIACWEALDPGDPALAHVRRLYEATLDAAERIPWPWIEGALAQRAAWRPGHWSPHLVLAALRPRGAAAGRVGGFAYGAHVPGYGGYACYLGVEESARGRGMGTRLMQLLQRLLEVDAFCEGVELPFVVWESRRPEPTAPPAEQALWQTRLRLFARLGAWWVAGLNFLAPNFARRQGPPVPLQLFLIPVARPAEALDSAALRRVAAGLLQGVYGRSAGDSLVQQTLPPDCRPSLRPALEADFKAN